LKSAIGVTFCPAEFHAKAQSLRKDAKKEIQSLFAALRNLCAFA
jgi:hypothetical protein